MNKGAPQLDYYSLNRSELLGLHQWRGGERVLDIGCGAGGNSNFLRSVGVSHLAGIEIVEPMAARAQATYDVVYVGSVESRLRDVDPSPDVVVAGDVLEHLVDPTAVLDQLHHLTGEGAVLLVSLPNVRHVSVIRMLVFGGGWEYRDSGIMDATHLRWFTRTSAVAMIEDSGWEVVACVPKFNTERQRSWSRRTAGRFDEFLAEQYLFRCRRSASRSTPPIPSGRA